MGARAGESFVVVGSVVGRNISPFSGFYGSSKFAVGAMAEALRQEVCSKGVRVSTVMPGIVVSEFQQVAGYNAENFGKALPISASCSGLRPSPTGWRGCSPCRLTST